MGNTICLFSRVNDASLDVFQTMFFIVIIISKDMIVTLFEFIL